MNLYVPPFLIRHLKLTIAAEKPPPDLNFLTLLPGRDILFYEGTVASEFAAAISDRAKKRNFLSVAHYLQSRTHLALGKDTGDARPTSTVAAGSIVALPEVCGLHHRYERRAA